MNSSAPDKVIVRHNASANRFEVAVNGQLAVADYMVQDERVFYTHTFVPPEMRGQGVAEKLVRAGLKWARAEGRKVVPQCSYVAVFIDRHSEFQDLLV